MSRLTDILKRALSLRIYSSQYAKGAITTTDIAAAKRIRALGFRGSYKGVRFNDDGVSEAEVSPEIIASLKEQFPSLPITDYTED